MGFSRYQYHGLTDSRNVNSPTSNSRKSADPVQSLLDSLSLPAETSKPPPANPSLPAPSGAKEYCMHWIFKGECAYQQTGCRYKHKIPTDPEAREKIGLRKTPPWVQQHPDPDELFEGPPLPPPSRPLLHSEGHGPWDEVPPRGRGAENRASGGASRAALGPPPGQRRIQGRGAGLKRESEEEDDDEERRRWSGGYGHHKRGRSGGYGSRN